MIRILIVFFFLVPTVHAGTLSWKVPPNVDRSVIWVEELTGEDQSDWDWGVTKYETTDNFYHFDLPDGLYYISIISYDGDEAMPRSEYYELKCTTEYGAHGLEWED